MQELLFPTLAFIGGDAEVHYWATLKNSFRALDPSFRMPLIISRMSYTWLTKRTEKLLKQRTIDISEVFTERIATYKMNWLMQTTSPPIDRLFKELKDEIATLHEPIQQLAQTISDDLQQQAERNLLYIEREIDRFQCKVLQKVDEK